MKRSKINEKEARNATLTPVQASLLHDPDLELVGVRSLAPRRRDRPRKSGAPRLGHHTVGQRVRGMGKTTLPRAGQGPLVSAGTDCS